MLRASRASVLKRFAKRSVRVHIPDQSFWIVEEELMSSDGGGSVGFCDTTMNRTDTSVSYTADCSGVGEMKPVTAMIAGSLFDMIDCSGA
jgi:hypothetical protein